jgi:hypothetical protein
MLTIGMLILIAVTLLQLRMITRAPYPTIRAIEALATSLPLFLLLFASAYLTMANSSASNFSQTRLTRTDTLYFTVTTFSTVGFGDITAVSQTARLVVTAQMLLDLLVLGLVVRAFIAAVQIGKRQAETANPPQSTRPAGDTS